MKIQNNSIFQNIDKWILREKYILGSLVIFLWAFRLFFNAFEHRVAVYYCNLSDALVLIFSILIIMGQLKKVSHENYLPKIIVWGMMALVVISPILGVLIVRAPLAAVFEYGTLYAAFMGVAAYFFSKI